MCTLIFASQVFDASPAFLASNRDEVLDRAASEPMLWDEDPAFVAPRDDQEGGTWLGVNEHGVLVAITNRFGTRRDSSRRSRGALVTDALGARTALAAAELAASHVPHTHNPFHLLLADSSAAYIVWSDGGAVTRFPLNPGVHVITERSFGAAPNGRADFIAGVVTELAAGGVLTPESLVRLLAVHRVNDLDATTVLLPTMNYGTRSSTVVDLQQRRFDFADGPPTEAAYLDYSDLLRRLMP